MPYQTRYVPPEILTVTPLGTYYHLYDDDELENPYNYQYQFLPLGEEYDEHDEKNVLDIRELDAYDENKEKEIRQSYDNFILKDFANYEQERIAYHASVIHQKDNYSPGAVPIKTYQVPFALEGTVQVQATSQEAAIHKLGPNDILRTVPDHVLIDALSRNLEQNTGFTLKVNVKESDAKERS